MAAWWVPTQWVLRGSWGGNCEIGRVDDFIDVDVDEAVGFLKG